MVQKILLQTPLYFCPTFLLKSKTDNFLILYDIHLDISCVFRNLDLNKYLTCLIMSVRMSVCSSTRPFKHHEIILQKFRSKQISHMSHYVRPYVSLSIYKTLQASWNYPSSFILHFHPSSFILHFATFKLFSLFRMQTATRLKVLKVAKEVS